nr:hypothetical protein [Tanacetum cinerariifolium]
MPWMMYGKNARNSMVIHYTHDKMKDSRKKNNGRVVLKRQIKNHLLLILKHLKSKVQLNDHPKNETLRLVIELSDFDPFFVRKNTSIGARDVGFGRGTHANEDAQG